MKSTALSRARLNRHGLSVMVLLLAATLMLTAGPLPFEPAEYGARRARFMDKIPDGFAVIRNSPSGNANLDFLYLCGVKVPNAVLILDSTRKESHLFYTTSEDYLKGEGLSPELARQPSAATGVDSCFSAGRFAPFLTNLVERVRVLYTPFTAEESRGDVASQSEWDGRLTRERQFVKICRDRFPGVEVRDCSEFIWQLRRIKSPAEIERLRIAGRIGAEAMVAVMKQARPGQYEYELSSLYEYACKRKGCQEMAFGVIISSAENHNYLHYMQHNRKLADGDFLVLDAGPSWQDYDTDITISFPINGKFTPRQREIYEACKSVSLLSLQFYKPGITGLEVGAKVKELLIQKGFDVTTDAFRRMRLFKEGGLTHYVGLATHDAGGRDVRPNEPVQVGMVFACDSYAIYPEEKLGVRVENTVLITETGCENLTPGIPREIDEIEKLMSGAAKAP